MSFVVLATSIMIFALRNIPRQVGWKLSQMTCWSSWMLILLGDFRWCTWSLPVSVDCWLIFWYEQTPVQELIASWKADFGRASWYPKLKYCTPLGFHYKSIAACAQQKVLRGAAPLWHLAEMSVKILTSTIDQFGNRNPMIGGKPQYTLPKFNNIAAPETPEKLPKPNKKKGLSSSPTMAFRGKLTRC